MTARGGVLRQRDEGIDVTTAARRQEDRIGGSSWPPGAAQPLTAEVAGSRCAPSRFLRRPGSGRCRPRSTASAPTSIRARPVRREAVHLEVPDLSSRPSAGGHDRPSVEPARDDRRSHRPRLPTGPPRASPVARYDARTRCTVIDDDDRLPVEFGHRDEQRCRRLAFPEWVHVVAPPTAAPVPRSHAPIFPLPSTVTTGAPVEHARRRVEHPALVACQRPPQRPVRREVDDDGPVRVGGGDDDRAPVHDVRRDHVDRVGAGTRRPDQRAGDEIPHPDA